MIDVISNPTVTMAISAVAGFLMKLKALDNERRQQERLQTLEAFKVGMSESTASADAAAARTPSNYGRASRRFIAFALVAAVIALVFVPGLLDKPSVIQTTKEVGGWLFGLFPGQTKTEFVSVQGFVHMPALLIGFGHVIAFYFGQAAAKP